MSFKYVTLRVPRISDLILLKIDAGGYLDLRDVRELMEVADREAIVVEIAEGLPSLPDALRSRWTDFLQNSSSIG